MIVFMHNRFEGNGHHMSCMYTMVCVHKSVMECVLFLIYSSSMMQTLHVGVCLLLRATYAIV